MTSIRTYAYGIVLLLVAYWSHQGWKSLVARGRQAAFRRDQRRKAGIPDSDTRPFSIAAAEAAQSRRLRQEGATARAKSQPNGSAISGSSNVHLSSQPFRTSGMLPNQSKSRRVSTDIPSTRAGVFLRRSSPANLSPATTAQRAAMLAPGQSSRYDPSTYASPDQFSPDIAHHAPRPVAGLKRSAARALSDAGSDVSTSTRRPERRLKKQPREEAYSMIKEEIDSEAGSSMTWEATAGAARGKKRGAQDVRDTQEEDSVFAGRGKGKRGRANEGEQDRYDNGDTMDEDEIDESEYEDEDLPLAGTDEETLTEEEDNIPRRTGAKLRTSLVKPRRTAIRNAPSQRTLRDEMLMLDDDESYADDSLQSLKARASSSKNRKEAKARDVPNEERSIGEEWIDPVNGLQWRMDEDEVLTEEEGSTTGRKRRVIVKRKVPRRLTVKREMRRKWDMPADSAHPDREELVPHYIPAWLSEQEFEEAKRRGDLGFQVGDLTAVSSGQDPVGTRSSPTRSPRNLDLLFHQPSNPRPLSGSRLGSPARESPLFRASSVVPGFNASGSTTASGNTTRKPGGRISLAGASPSPSSDSSLRSRVLDTVGKRRREEELLRKLRENTQAKSTPRNSPLRSVTSSSTAPTPPLTSVKLEEEKTKVENASQVPSSDADEGKKETHYTSTSAPQARPSSNVSFSFGKSQTPDSTSTGVEANNVTPAAPFSVGGSKVEPLLAPTEASTTSAKSTTSSPFTFGAPSTKAPTPAAVLPSKPFTFDVPSGGKALPKQQTAPTSFTFGAPKGGEVESNAGGGQLRNTPSFGAPLQKSSLPSSSPAPFSFSSGANGSSSTATPDVSKAPIPFTFGAPPATNSSSGGAPGAGNTANGVQNKPAFTFGAATGSGGQGGSSTGGGGFTFSFGKR